MNATQQPKWDPLDKPKSLINWGTWLHEEAKRTFLRDKTHGQMLFLFNDDGLCSISPIPPNTSSEQITAGVRQAVQENNLYGVITISEAWAYFPEDKNDHTSFQLLDGEMKVADLNDEDKTEALLVKTESKDRGGITWVDKIVRDGDEVSLGKALMMDKKDCLGWQGYFE
ncbi:hypothetical protein ACFLS1_08515 [Verrucomicrobiota bacterium]